MKFKKGDEIIITAGKDRGKRGKIEAVFPQDQKVLVPGLNIFKRHVKRKDEKNPGGILDMPRSLSVAKVALICPRCHQLTRIGYQGQDKSKERFCRKCKQVL